MLTRVELVMDVEHEDSTPIGFVLERTADLVNALILEEPIPPVNGGVAIIAILGAGTR